MPLPLLRQAALALYQQAPVSRSRLSNIRLSVTAYSRVTNSSTTTTRLLATTRSSKASSPNSTSGKVPPLDDQPTPPKVTFSDLGASKKVKLFVIAVLMVFATMESIFWMKVFWAKFGPTSNEEHTDEGANRKRV